MARDGQYYYYGNSFWDHFALPAHLVLFGLILLAVLGLSFYLNYESVVEDLTGQLNLFILLCPLLLLLLVHLLSGHDRPWAPLLASLPDSDSLHRAGGSAWGVAAVLLLLLVMVSFQSSFHDRWFPLLG